MSPLTDADEASISNLPIFSEDLCLRTFIVTVIALSAIALVVGILALLVAEGWSLTGLNSICSLNSIGEINSYMLIIGGLSLFILGNLAWVYQIKHEKEAKGETKADPLLFTNRSFAEP